MRLQRWLDGTLTLCAVGAVGFLGVGYFHSRTPDPAQQRIQDQLTAVRQLEHTTLPPLQVLSDSGAARTLDLRRGGTKLVMVFRSTCAYCEMNAPSWVKVANQFPSVTTIATNIEDAVTAKQWLTSHHLRATETIVPANVSELVAQWRASSVPMTMVVDSAGTVEFARLGVLSTQDLDSLNAVLTSRSTQSHTLSAQVRGGNE